MKKFFSSPSYFFRFLYLLFTVLFVIFLVFIFGRAMLASGLPGNDNANFITLADWLGKWFPRIPFWYPQQGAGMSFTASYPILTHLMLVVLTKLTRIPIAVVFRFFMLATVVLTSLGIYLLGLRITKSQTVALLASVFYPLSPIAWIFLLEWGFTAEQTSYIFVAPAIIFFDLFASSLLEEGTTVKKRIYFLLFLFFSVLILLSHPLTFLGFVVLAIPLFIIYPLFLPASQKKKILTKSILAGIAFLFLTAGASAFWLVPYGRYQKIVREDTPVANPDSFRKLIIQNSIYPINFFNISTKVAAYNGSEDSPKPLSGWAWRNVSFPIAISILALIGIIGAFFLNKKLFALGLASLFPLGVGLSPGLEFLLYKIPILTYFSNWRSLLVTSRIIIPILAGFGCYVLAYLLVFWVKKRAFILGFLSLLIAAGFLYFFKNWPENPNYLISYGPEILEPYRKFDTRNVWQESGQEHTDYCLIPDIVKNGSFPVCENSFIQKSFIGYKLDKACRGLESKGYLSSLIAALCGGKPTSQEIKEILSQCAQGISSGGYKQICEAKAPSFWQQISPSNWYRLFFMDKEGAKEIVGKEERRLFEYLPSSTKGRIDVGVSLGSLVMLEPFYSQVPELPVYFNQGSLVSKMWNYESEVANSSKIWLQSQILTELAKYFGLEYTLLSEDAAPLDKFRNEGWKQVRKIEKVGDSYGFGGLALWHAPQANELLTVTTRPLVMVIGQKKVDAYFRIFKLANIGGLSFDQAILVDGGENIENYTSAELAKFDAVVLDGYQYRNRSEVWTNLEKYIREGGTLFINTGWQYTSADWQLDGSPEFFPFKKLYWSDSGKTNDFKIENADMITRIDTAKFSPLIFDNSAWGFSTGERGDLREWAKVILSVEGKPLIAGGSFGQGRVIWTGFDLPGHIDTYSGNPEEVQLFNSLLTYLLAGKGAKDIPSDFSRNYPDRVEFSFKGSSEAKTAVYWREAYYKDFKAEVMKNGKAEHISTYKAGPGLTLIVLPKIGSGTRIVLEYKTPLVVQFARVVSFGTVVLLILYLFDWWIFKKYVIAIKTRLTSPFKNLTHWWKSEEE